MENTGRVIPSKGQQIIVQVTQNVQDIQLAAQQLELQVLPLPAIQGANEQFEQPAQMLQTTYGPTYIFQPMDPTITATTVPTVINVNGNIVQLATAVPATGSSVQQSLPGTSSASNYPVSMMVGDRNGGLSQYRSPVVGEQPLYVNPKQYKRILYRRQARAKLIARIPKSRQKFLHQSRHKHAMNRIRCEGGKFSPRPVKKIKRELYADYGKSVENGSDGLIPAIKIEGNGLPDFIDAASAE